MSKAKIMKKTNYISFVTLLILISFNVCHSKTIEDGNTTNFPDDEIAARQYINEIMPTIKKNLDWAAELNFKDRSKISFVDKLGLDHETAEIEYFLKNLTEKLKTYPYESFKDEDLKKQIKLLIIKDYRILSDRNQNEMEDLLTQSSTIHDHIKVCPYLEISLDKCNLRFFDIYFVLYYDISEEMLKWYWSEWRSKAGKFQKSNFDRYVELYRKAAALNGFTKPSEMMLNKYEDKYIVMKMANAIEEIRSFYQKLHAFIRHKLIKEYGNSTLSDRLPIPLHLVERFSAEFGTLNSLLSRFYPYPESPVMKSDDRIIVQNFTPIKMLHQADEFYKSLGIVSILEHEKDWKEHVQVIPEDFYASCRSKSVGIFEGNSFYFAICSEPTLENFLYTHGEAVDVFQHLYTSGLSLPFRREQFEILLQPIKEAIMLSVSSRPHISKLGLVELTKTAQESWINRLFYLALEKIVPLLDSFVETKYLADILDGSINSSDSNCIYWKLQEDYLGVQPPVERSQDDFDIIATKFGGYEEGDYEDVFAQLASFKIYEGLCRKASNITDEPSELSECDFTGSKDVGTALIEKLSLGSKMPWQQLLKYLTDDTEMSGSSILRYFKPLEVWLEDYITKNRVHVGWEEANMCK